MPWDYHLSQFLPMTIYPVPIRPGVLGLVTASYPSCICWGLLACGPWLLCLRRFRFIYIAFWILPIVLSCDYSRLFAFVIYIFLCNFIMSFGLLCLSSLAKNYSSQMLFVHLNYLLMIILPFWVYSWRRDLGKSSSPFLHSYHPWSSLPQF